jgi:uncharacterized protein (TIGR02001 family)
MKAMCIGLIVAAGLGGAARAADVIPPADSGLTKDWGHLYGYVDWTSDYRFTGASESNRHGTIQGGLHWAAPDDFYLGVFTSHVDFNDFRGTSTEVDLYGGKHIRFGGNDLNLEVLYGDYPDTAGHASYLPAGTILPTYNFLELAAELTHSFGALSVAGKTIVEPRPDSHGGTLTSLNGSASYPVTGWLAANAHFGHQWVTRGVDASYGDAGLTATWRQQWVFDLRYYATDIRRADCYGTNWCGPALVAKVTYQFIVL